MIKGSNFVALFLMSKAIHDFQPSLLKFVIRGGCFLVAQIVVTLIQQIAVPFKHYVPCDNALSLLPVG